MNKCLLFLQALLVFNLSSIFGNGAIGDTVHQLNEVKIIGSRLQHYTPGNHIQLLDSLIIKSQPASSLADILSQYSSIQINSYGLGGLSDASVRGSGSNQVAVLWNGFNLQDILNGTVNFAEIPAFVLDDVKILYGGCSALYGSGAIGGAIQLNNNLKFNEGPSASAMFSAGSFSNFFESVKMKISSNYYAGNFSFFNQSALNNFPYKNTADFGAPVEKQINDKSEQLGFSADNDFKVSEKQIVSLHLWLQDNHQQIPPNMTITSNDEKQEDKVERITIDWSRKGAVSDFYVRSGLFNNYLFYDNTPLNVHSKYQSTSSVTEFETDQRISHFIMVNTGLNLTHEHAISHELEQNPTRNREAFFSSAKLSSYDLSWNGVISIRKEMINNGFKPLTWSVGFDGKIWKGLIFKGSISKNYRVPAFDDLYYVGSGNPNLKNEYGYNEELGLNYEFKPGAFGFEAGATAFNSNLTERIIWIPLTTAYWIPINIGKNWNRGIENNIGIIFKPNKLMVKLSGYYTYVLSTDETPGSSTLHQQIIYVPKNKIAANFEINYRDFSCIYAQNYVDRRYASGDHEYSVEPHSASNLTVGKSFKMRRFEIQINGQVNNIWNSNYQVMLNYPMPLRNYKIGIRINYQ